MLLDGIDDELSKSFCALPAFAKGGVHCEANSLLLAMLTDEFYFSVGVGSEAIEGHYDCLSEALQVSDVAIEVSQALTYAFEVLFLQ